MYLIQRNKIVLWRNSIFLSRNNCFRTLPGRSILYLGGQIQANTAKFDAAIAVSKRRQQTSQRFCCDLLARNYVFRGSHTPSLSEQSTSFIRICPPRYDDARTAVAVLLVSMAPLGSQRGPTTDHARRYCHDSSAYHPHHTHEIHTPRLETHGIVDSRRTLSKLRYTRHPTVRSCLR